MFTILVVRYYLLKAIYYKRYGRDEASLVMLIETPTAMHMVEGNCNSFQLIVKISFVIYFIFTLSLSLSMDILISSTSINFLTFFRYFFPTNNVLLIIPTPQSESNLPFINYKFSIGDLIHPKGNPSMGSSEEILSKVEFHPQWLKNPLIDG